MRLKSKQFAFITFNIKVNHFSAVRYVGIPYKMNEEITYLLCTKLPQVLFRRNIESCLQSDVKVICSNQSKDQFNLNPRIGFPDLQSSSELRLDNLGWIRTRIRLDPNRFGSNQVNFVNLDTNRRRLASNLVRRSSTSLNWIRFGRILGRFNRFDLNLI